ncbi:MAG: cobalamin-binding protein [Desulfobacterales bacterium]|nr:cobalamin-binding protein [Desulfobacterales bacterium]
MKINHPKGSTPRSGRFRTIRTIAAVIALAMVCLPAGAAADTVVDQLGRTVSVPEHPERIVALAPSITEIVFALNAEDRLAGVTRFSDYPEAAHRLPKVGSYVHLDLEKIVSLAPDLCIAVKDGNPIGVIRRLEALGIPVYAVDPRDIDSVIDTIVELGRIVDARPRAEALAADLRRRVDQVRSNAGKAPRKPKVFFQIGIAPIVSVGTETFIHELIELAGGTNLAAGSTPYPRFSREQVLAMAPEIFIITSMARGQTFERVKSEWEQWPSMPAAKTGRILLVDSNLFDRSSPRLVDGLEELARIIHPEIFGEAP